MVHMYDAIKKMSDYLGNVFEHTVPIIHGVGEM